MNSAEAPQRFLFLLASTRRDGNSEQMARIAAAGLPEGTACEWWRLAESPLPPFADRRHAGGFSPVEGNARELMEATLRATDLVLATPVYWYALPAAGKLYFDHWAAWLREPGPAFEEPMQAKRLWALISDAAHPGEVESDLVQEALARTARYMGMAWMGAVVGHGSAPGSVFQDPALEGRLRQFLAPPSGGRPGST